MGERGFWLLLELLDSVLEALSQIVDAALIDVVDSAEALRACLCGTRKVIIIAYCERVAIVATEVAAILFVDRNEDFRAGAGRMDHISEMDSCYIVIIDD